MSEKKLKTVPFGGFDKEQVLLYLKELYNTHENEIKEKDTQIEALNQQILKIQEKLSAKENELQEKVDQIGQFAEVKKQYDQTILIKEDKIDTLSEQNHMMQEHMEKLQGQARNLIEETKNRYEAQIEALQNESEEKIKEAKQNAFYLFNQIDEDYKDTRKKYADMVHAICELNNYIQEAQKHSMTRLNKLPESLMKK